MMTYKSFRLLDKLSIFLSSAWILVIVTLIAIRVNAINSHPDLILGFVFSILMMVMSLQNEEENQNIITNISLWVSEFSYTIYLTHLPFLIFILSLIIKNERWQPDTQHLGYTLIIFIITILYAKIVYFFTEKHTVKLRNYLKTILSISRKS